MHLALPLRRKLEMIEGLGVAGRRHFTRRRPADSRTRCRALHKGSYTRIAREAGTSEHLLQNADTIPWALEPTLLRMRL